MRRERYRIRQHGVRIKSKCCQAGIDIENISGSQEQGYISETMSAGVAALDADGDGFLDLFIIGGTKNNLTQPTGSQHLFVNKKDAKSAINILKILSQRS